MRRIAVLCCFVLTFFVSGSEAQPPLPPPKPSLMRWMTDKSPAAQKFRAQLEGADEELQAARETSRDMLVVVQLAQLQKPIPASNAATDYEELAAVLRAKPITEAVQNIATQAACNGAVSKEEMQTLRAFFDERRDIWRIIENGASKDECVFQRDWAQGFEMKLPEYATIRQAATLLCARQAVLLNEDKFDEALALVPLGYSMASHAGSDPILISYVVGVAIEKMVGLQLESILRRSNNNEAIISTVRELVVKKCPLIKLSQAIQGEVSIAFATLNALRAAKPAQWTKTLNLLDGSLSLYSSQRVPDEFTGDEKQFLNNVLDIVEARWMKRMRQDIEYREQLINGHAAAQNDVEEIPLSTRLIDPVKVFLTSLYPSLVTLIHQELAKQTQADCLRVACDVLLHRMRQGTLPNQLPAMPDSLTKMPLTYERFDSGFVVLCKTLPKSHKAEFYCHFAPR